PEGAADAANAFATAALDLRDEQLAESAQGIAEELEMRLAATPRSDTETRALLAARLDQVRSVEDTGDPTMLLSQHATPPTSAVGASSTLVLALALIVGFTLGAGAAVLLELTTRRVRDEAEALAFYPLPVLTRVPIVAQRRRRARDGSNWYMPPLIRESFRTLAVQLMQRDRPPRSILITSATRGDGKSTSTINLAVTLAGMGRQVVLLDFDLRNPQVGMGLGLAGGPGLRDLVDPEVEIGRLLAAPFELGSLRVVPVRFDPPDAPLIEAALAGLPRLVEQARGLADYVIVDTPPLGEVSDALNLAAMVDDVVLVIRPGNTNRSQLGVTRELLERIGVAPLGYVVIGTEDGLGGISYGRGYGEAGRGLVIGEAGEPARSSEERVARSSPGRRPSAQG
ncbi:MAG TPA: CpsD/CapB family tyrosine-protein kinase, partial [Solirubrobacterales bacterium]|nr:CpsD/CapB family tyrosine-protein kinase [Solirubrobacterales bacterium]